MIRDPVVYLVDDDERLRTAIQWLVEANGLTVRAFASAKDFLESFNGSEHGCLLLDVRMPGMSGLQLLEALQARGATLPAILLTGYADVDSAVQALRMRAFDLLQKPFGEADLIGRVRAAIEHDRRAREAADEREQARGILAALSPREGDVMRLLVQGRANKDIAEVLGLSTRTVEGHRGNLMAKLRVSSLAELVRLALLAEGSGQRG